MDSVTEENVETIMKEKENTEKDIEVLQRHLFKLFSQRELNTLEKEYDKYKLIREKIQTTGSTGTVKKANKKIKIVKK